MNKIYFIPILLLICRIAIGQGIPTYPTLGTQSISATSSKNYIKTITYKDANPSLSDASEANVDITYFDGLGRPIQQNAALASPTGLDVITRLEYDDFGRQTKNYLPYTKSGASNGGYISNITSITDQRAFISGLYGSSESSYGLSETAYQNSPLHRIDSVSSPGADWHMEGGHVVKYAYRTNSSAVAGYCYTGAGYQDYTNENYARGTLHITETTDEDGNMTRKYTDLEGKIILQEAYGDSYLASGTWHKTRYCYDDFGLLRCVIQPKGSSPASTDYCFYYLYDGQKRLIGKKTPSADWEYMAYDLYDRVVATQDGKQRNANQWCFIKYDDLNRVSSEGMFSSTLSRDDIEEDAKDGTLWSSVFEIYQQNNYYDNFSNYACTYCPQHSTDRSALGGTVTGNNTGRLTGTMSQVPMGGPSKMIYTAYYYDKYGRVIQTVTKNQFAEMNYVTHKYSFDGLVLQTRERQIDGSSNVYIDYFYDYDHRGRLLKTRLKINGGSETVLSANVYDEAGQLIDKYIHYTSGSDYMQRSDYQYNIRGWLTNIDNPGTFSNGDQFGMQLYYNAAATGGIACYNGNISGIKWGNNTTGHSNLLYNFSYDRLNRLTGADFYGSTNFDATYSYDKNGNPVHLSRYNGSGQKIDDLWYAHTGNKINWIDDAAGGLPKLEGYPGTGLGFAYDQSGNLTWEPVKSVSIDYNRLNLSDELNFGNDQKTLYFYLPDGTKLRKEVENNNGTLYKTDYCGSFVYETIGTTRSLKYILTPEGRILPDGSGGWDLEYHLKDHLGNVRVALKDDGTILQENHYYPFGMEMTSLSSTNTTNKNLYRYNGKELQEDYDLGWLDYGARFYEPALVVFHTLDPLAEKYSFQSPYLYASNNPIRYIDYMGMNSNEPNKEENNESKEEKPNILGQAIAFYLACLAMQGEVLNENVFGNENSTIDEDIVTGFNHNVMIFAPVLSSLKLDGSGGTSEYSSTDDIVTVPEKNVVAEKVTSLADDAASLANKIGKNTVKVEGEIPGITYHFDLVGPPHKGVPSPHIQRSILNTNPNTGKTFLNKDNSWVKPMTQSDYDFIYNYLNNLKKQ